MVAMNARMPALYIGHGAPPLLDDALWTGQLAAWAADLPRPTAILIVSAHWESAPVMPRARAGAPLVYDFGGFAQKYYEMTYATPDATALAEPDRGDDAGQRAGAPAPLSRGLDHGAWVPLKIMYPDADIPVLQMSLPTQDPDQLLELGERLRPLRDEGVLIIGSGFLTHGLPFLRDFRIDAAAPRLVGRVRRLGRRGAGPRRRRRAGGVPSPRPRACPTRTRPSSTTRRCSSRSARPPTPDEPGDQLVDGFWMGLSKRSLQVRLTRLAGCRG